MEQNKKTDGQLEEKIKPLGGQYRKCNIQKDKTEIMERKKISKN